MSNTQFTPEFLARKTWDLYQSQGVPLEVSEDILDKNGYQLDKKILNQLIEEHQKMSQDSSKNQFKSGLATDGEMSRRLHTTTHILHQTLREIFGNSVAQKGSAITDEKARFDITLPADQLDEAKILEIQSKVQAIINQKLEMKSSQMSETKARELGAIGLFGEKYGEEVTIYQLEDKNGRVYSCEFCGGPHIQNTSEIGQFEITKKKSIGQGLTRLEFVVE